MKLLIHFSIYLLVHKHFLMFQNEMTSSLTQPTTPAEPQTVFVPTTTNIGKLFVVTSETSQYINQPVINNKDMQFRITIPECSVKLLEWSHMHSRISVSCEPTALSVCNFSTFN